MRFHSAFRGPAQNWHRLVARSPLAARLYLGALSRVLRSLAPARIRQQILNSISSVNWPFSELAPRSVRLGSSIDVRLTPHLGEFDMEAVTSRTLSYEAELFAFLEPRLPYYDVVIEIGANVGVFSLFFARTLARAGRKNARVFAFEPSREAFFRLLANARLNPSPNLIPFNCAVGSKTGFHDFFEPRGHLTNGSLDSAFAGTFSDRVDVNQVLVVDARLLMPLLPESGNILIKIDTEGSECAVLEGLYDLIQQRKPDIILEVLPGYEQRLSDARFLRSGSYSLFNITSSGLQPYETFQATEHRDYFLSAGMPESFTHNDIHDQKSPVSRSP
jgi:FkbM family methyltransferase